MLAIAGMTIRELRRRRLSLVPVVALVLGLLLVIVAGVGDASSDVASVVEARVFVAGSVSAYAFVVTLVTIAAASGLVADEIEQGTVLLLALRPIRRRTVVVGKLLGMLTMVTVAMLAWGLLGGLAVSVMLGHGLVGATVASSLASVFGVLLLACFAAAMSAIFSSRNALIFTVLAWVLSLGAQNVYDAFHDHPGDQVVQNFGWVGTIAHAIALALPRAHLQHLAAQVVGHGAAGSGHHVGIVSGVLAIAAVAFWAWLAGMLFEHRRSLT